MQNFLGLNKKYSKFEDSNYCVYLVPYERTTTYVKGTQKGPSAIIQASQQVELYDEEMDFEPSLAGICTIQGQDFSLINEEKECFNLIEEDVTKLLDQNKFVLSLGGEHSITYPLVKAHLKKYPDLSVLQLDAHADLRYEYLDSIYNHACVMSRVQEIAKVIGVGIRSLSSEEKDWIKKNKYSIWFAHQMYDNPYWMEEVISELENPVYLTIDIDFFNPAIIPATGTPEPGGFFWKETLNFLKMVFSQKNVVGCDVVELAPQNGFHSADFMIARLVYKLIGFKEFYLE